MKKKPVVRIIHHLSRSGGTVISRCLGSMKGVVLLSEIHPLGAQVHNPLQQASDWFGLFSRAELDSFKDRTFTFIEAISLIRDRVEEAGKCLVIRDWAHLDFTGIPFLEQPAYRLMTADVLRPHYQVIQTATVRHPVDQWLSLNKLEMFNYGTRPQIKSYIYGYRRFAEFAVNMGYVKYEDFTADSNQALQTLCKRLLLSYDGGYRDQWHDYTTITGNNTTPSGSRLVEHAEIQSLPRQELNRAMLEEFQRYPDYHQALELLGYRSD